jgi:siroheme synthase
MGLANLGEIASRLIEAGLPEATPAAAIANGTTAQRRICRATLAELPSCVAAAKLESPVLVVIGRVAALADMLGPRLGAQAEAALPARHA